MGIIISHDKCTKCNVCITKCPFNALELEDNKITVNAACKVCKICVKACSFGAISYEESSSIKIDKTLYKDFLIYVEQFEGNIHPVSYELIGKALELAKVVNQNVNAIVIGHNIQETAKDLYRYGVNTVYVYDSKEYEYFRMDLYQTIFVDLIKRIMPHTILVGATNLGRSLAPRIAANFKTGLTADCTVLETRENTDLVQIRPAFGGNIMAKIITRNHRPQMATVRYKVMEKALDIYDIKDVVNLKVDMVDSNYEIKNVIKKDTQVDISEAEIIVVMGNGVKDDKGIKLIEKFAQNIGATLACTRPVVEKGKMSYLYQIGLSGRTCKPKLIITVGVSGAIQFVAGMNNSETIVAINNDENAPIFKIAHYGIVDDLYEVLEKINRRFNKEVYNV